MHFEISNSNFQSSTFNLQIQFSNLNSEVISFKEKPKVEDGWINGGFFVIEPEFFEYLDNDETILEQKPLPVLDRAHQIFRSLYQHGHMLQLA